MGCVVPILILNKLSNIW